MRTFKEWMKIKESTAFTRARAQSAKGLGPDMPEAEENSHDTAPPWEREAFDKKRHKKKKKK